MKGERLVFYETLCIREKKNGKRQRTLCKIIGNKGRAHLRLTLVDEVLEVPQHAVGNDVRRALERVRLGPLSGKVEEGPLHLTEQSRRTIILHIASTSEVGDKTFPL